MRLRVFLALAQSSLGQFAIVGLLVPHSDVFDSMTPSLELRFA